MDKDGVIMGEMLDYLSIADFEHIDIEEDGGDIHVFDEKIDDIDAWIIDDPKTKDE